MKFRNNELKSHNLESFVIIHSTQILIYISLSLNPILHYHCRGQNLSTPYPTTFFLPSSYSPHLLYKKKKGSQHCIHKNYHTFPSPFILLNNCNYTLYPTPWNLHIPFQLCLSQGKQLRLSLSGKIYKFLSLHDPIYIPVHSTLLLFSNHYHFLIAPLTLLFSLIKLIITPS